MEEKKELEENLEKEEDKKAKNEDEEKDSCVPLHEVVLFQPDSSDGMLGQSHTYVAIYTI